MKFFYKMADIKKIASKILIFILDISLFSYSVAKQIVLPAKRKKGNLLSSLFIFFVGILERLDSFEYGVFRMANILRQKYIKQTLLIIAAILFLLSSFEWTGVTNANANANFYSGSYIARGSETSSGKINISNYAYTPIYSATTCFDKHFLPYRILVHSHFPFTGPVKTFLLIQNIRIWYHL